jgi:hypothetical protein
MPSPGTSVTHCFEYELSPETLNEEPRQTAIDWLVTGDETVICIEAKFMEEEFGRCSCESRQNGDCSPRVMARPYWAVARDAFGLEGPCPPEPCALEFAYQPVRLAAAAQALAEGRLRPVFGLFYDARNPYFTGAGNWPGWVAVLQETLSARSDVAFYAVSWQALLASVPLDDETRAWAVEKHGLEGVDT